MIRSGRSFSIASLSLFVALIPILIGLVLSVHDMKESRHAPAVTCLIFSPDGKTLGAAVYSRRVVSTETPNRTVPFVEGHLDFFLCDVEQRLPLNHFDFVRSTPIVFSRGRTVGTMIWDVTSDGSQLGIRDTNSIEERILMMGEDGALEVAHSQAGKDVLVTAKHRMITVTDGHGQRRNIECENWVESMAISPDGSTLATGDMIGSVVLWDLETLQEKGRLNLRRPKVAYWPISFGLLCMWMCLAIWMYFHNRAKQKNMGSRYGVAVSLGGS